MMVTLRRPKTPIVRRQITAEAVAEFRAWRDCGVRCTCPEPDWAGEYWHQRECAACDEGAKHYSALVSALGLEPWESICDPHAANFYPPWHANHQWHIDQQQKPGNAELFAALTAAANRGGRKS